MPRRIPSRSSRCPSAIAKTDPQAKTVDEDPLDAVTGHLGRFGDRGEEAVENLDLEVLRLLNGDGLIGAHVAFSFEYENGFWCGGPKPNPDSLTFLLR